MARKLRVEYEGAIYHVMNRGDRREPIFREDADRALFLERPSQRVGWLRVGRLLGEMGIPKDSAAGRKELERRMELRRWEDQPEQWKRVRRGWCLGDEAFRKELLAQMAEQAGASHYGEELRESAEEKGQRIVGEEMKRLEWKEIELQRRRKGDPEKVGIACRLRQESTMTLKWI